MSLLTLALVVAAVRDLHGRGLLAERRYHALLVEVSVFPSSGSAYASVQTCARIDYRAEVWA